MWLVGAHQSYSGQKRLMFWVGDGGLTRGGQREKADGVGTVLQQVDWDLWDHPGRVVEVVQSARLTDSSHPEWAWPRT